MSSSDTIPIELIELMLQELAQKDLSPVLQTNRTFYSIAVRLLYRKIGDLPIARLVACLKVLECHATFPAFVHDLYIDWSQYHVTANLLRLLRRILQQLRNLRFLHVELSPRDNLASHAWVFVDGPYRLRTFTTSTRCDNALARILERQPLIQELSLRGFQTNMPFVLSSTALPQLNSLRCTHADASVIAEVIRGRPVEGISISLFADEGLDPLDTLRLPSISLKRLTLMALDDVPATNLLREVAERVPQLEALHIVVLLSHYTSESLMEAGPVLSNFKELRYITVMGGLGASVTNDHHIAKEWHKHCTTLKTIILPKGQVWFERDGDWSCCV
ncbi:uncharacterized protein C8Q71DRAFT_794799 [Rhodofomes roseus]|uniref:F-box domain-containing protein n=1 Tax=Rhodofomes roseus TaxID=34475 RepID=A0ABQ8KQI7_9APHY|nr:uncharacterized protein C8Q71DRAFT_794799 [Rhodofomes roseus]KAH9840657.1 hypothetical protein C8Q71DRAFT_794799 [Rhodofomes roseus]